MKNNELSVAKIPSLQDEKFNITKVAKYISTTSGLVNKEDKTCLVTMPSKNVMVTLDLMEKDDVSLSSKNVTMYDLAVMDSVYTLYKSGCSEFTPEMIAKVMSGDLHAYIKPQKAGSVRKSLDKLASIRISLDITDELLARGLKLKEGERGVLKDYLLPLREMQLKAANGKVIQSGFQLKEIPILYDYAERTGHIATVPTTMLEVDSVTDTDDNIIIKRYLIRRIEELKQARNKKSLSEIIYYDTELQTGAMSELWYDKNIVNLRDKKSELHKSVKKVLKSLVEKQYIQSYEELKDGRSVVGVKINLNKEN